jgi:hypothetical protein
MVQLPRCLACKIPRFAMLANRLHTTSNCLSGSSVPQLTSNPTCSSTGAWKRSKTSQSSAPP